MIQMAVMSDSHGQYQTVETVLEYLQSKNINTIIHCGDIDDSETIWLFKGFTTHFVFGNCDIDRASIRQAVHGIGGTMHEPFGNLELDGKKIAFIHSDDYQLTKDIEHSGHFDFLFYGHTHEAAEHLTGPTRVINPGALHRANPKSFAILDLPEGNLQRIELESII